MSVELKNLTKKYGEQVAVNDIFLTINKGEIVGFLGPNGAGKSTTMKMLTCYVPPTSGTALVNGFDIVKDPIEVRKAVGYLPEHNPLYKDMYVREFLLFAAGIHGISNKKQRIKELIEMTGLGLEQHKLIGALSKGYRQRVGLAQAMIHDPDVLILDEPTSGLDPNQLSEIRALIKRIGQEKTVIFSTHIMQEVTAICNRVLIINRGDLVADDPIGSLTDRVVQGQQFHLEFENAGDFTALKQIPGILEAKVDGRIVKVVAEQDVRKEIFQWAVQKERVLLSMMKDEVTVENVFKELTKNGKDV